MRVNCTQLLIIWFNSERVTKRRREEACRCKSQMGKNM